MPCGSLSVDINPALGLILNVPMQGSFEIDQRIAVYGPSGSGKTTLARLIGEGLGLPRDRAGRPLPPAKL